LKKGVECTDQHDFFMQPWYDVTLFTAVLILCLNIMESIKERVLLLRYGVRVEWSMLQDSAQQWLHPLSMW